ncbi:ABC transporter permease [Planctomycetota bacterium]
MKAILWKEFRENLKWAALAFFIMSAGILVVFVDFALQLREPYPVPMPPILDDDCYGFIIAVSCIAGFLIGLLQVIFEIRPGYWAFLVHRPLSRSAIFIGKVMAGLTLYFLACGIPLVLAGWWLSVPGHISMPFHWSMMQPAAAFVLMGAVFYFAGMLTGLRKARWFVSRICGLVPAVLCAFVVFIVPHFWHALVTIAISCLLIGVAAWGTFLTRGTYRRQPMLAKIAVAACLFFLIQDAFIGVMIGWNAVRIEIIDDTSQYDQPRAEQWTRYGITKKGEVVKYSTAYNGDLTEIVAVHNTDGEPLPFSKDCHTFHREELAEMCLASLHRPSFLTMGSYIYPHRYLFKISRFKDASGRESVWWFDCGDNIFTGYDVKSRERIGAITPEGFVPAGTTTSQSFKGNFRTFGYSYRYSADDTRNYIFADAIYNVDIMNRSVKKLGGIPGGNAVTARGEYWVEQNDRRVYQGDIVVSNDKICLLDKDGKVLFSAECKPGKKYDYIIFAVADNREKFFVKYTSYSSHLQEVDGKIEKTSNSDLLIFEYAADGRLIKRHEIPSLEYQVGQPYILPKIDHAYLVPPCLVPCRNILIDLLGNNFPELDQDEFEELKYILKIDTTTIIVVIALLACYLWLGYLLCRRYNLTKASTVTWLLAILLLGPAGLLMLLCSYEWPAMVPCSSCGKKRSAAYAVCPHCDSRQPEPALEGTEILESISSPEPALVSGPRA